MASYNFNNAFNIPEAVKKQRKYKKEIQSVKITDSLINFAKKLMIKG